MRLIAVAMAIVFGMTGTVAAFDGNDRLFDPDQYQSLPANDDGVRVADYRPYGSQVTSGWGTSSWFDSEPEAPIAAYAPRTFGYRSTIQKTNSARRDGYREGNVVCVARLSASTALPRGGSSWARSAAEKAWRKTVTATHGAAYASFALARGKEWDCSGTIVSRCHVEATPCRSTY